MDGLLIIYDKSKFSLHMELSLQLDLSDYKDPNLNWINNESVC